jgi:hypothetical protein
MFKPDGQGGHHAIKGVKIAVSRGRERGRGAFRATFRLLQTCSASSVAAARAQKQKPFQEM